tara:strand:+ start:2060 stop:2350 length:291 start_codon:yes stop_codon:yes gene_type:complete
MEEKTAEEIAAIFTAAADSVTLINADATYSAYSTRLTNAGFIPNIESEWKDAIKRNVEHLELIKDYKKSDGTTSIWTSESFTDIDAAITKGKTLYS